MASTNKTANYELSQFIGSDKPDFLTDYNGDMLNVDNTLASVNAKADAAEESALAATVSANSAQETASRALANVKGAYTLAQSAIDTATEAKTESTNAVHISEAAMQSASAALAKVEAAKATAEEAKDMATSLQTWVDDTATPKFTELDTWASECNERLDTVEDTIENHAERLDELDARGVAQDKAWYHEHEDIDADDATDYVTTHVASLLKNCADKITPNTTVSVLEADAEGNIVASYGTFRLEEWGNSLNFGRCISGSNPYAYILTAERFTVTNWKTDAPTCTAYQDMQTTPATGATSVTWTHTERNTWHPAVASGNHAVVGVKW